MATPETPATAAATDTAADPAVFGFTHLYDREIASSGGKCPVHMTSGGLPVLFTSEAAAQRYADRIHPTAGEPPLRETHYVSRHSLAAVEAALLAAGKAEYVLDGQVRGARSESTNEIGVPVEESDICRSLNDLAKNGGNSK